MSDKKVLLVDDSLTIQKVIKITLSSKPFTIVDCFSSDEMTAKLNSENFDILLLDFKISETTSGYELAAEVKKNYPNIQTLMMYGTFDNVDENLLNECGVNYHINKPFDGNRFISLVNNLSNDHDNIVLSETQNNDSSNIEAAIPDVIDDDDDNWDVSTGIIDTPVEIESFTNDNNELINSMNDWGMEIPGIIDSSLPDSDSLELPPVIGGEFNHQMSETLIDESPVEEVVEKMVDINESSVVEIGRNSEKSTNFSESSAEDSDFWNADIIDIEEESEIEIIEDNEFDLTRPNDTVVAINDSSDEVEEAHTEIEFETLNIADETPVNFSKVDLSSLKDEILNEIRDELKQLVMDNLRDIVTEIGKDSIEKVSWETIPDLAENIITKSINEIKDKCMDEDLH